MEGINPFVLFIVILLVHALLVLLNESFNSINKKDK